MFAPSRLRMLGTVAGLAFVVLDHPASAADAKDTRFFDPVLDGAFCTAGTAAGSLLRHYQKLAKAETRPFSPPSGAQSGAHEADAPLFDNLGTLSLRISTSSALAQKYFDQGLRLAFAFNHAEARRAFRTAQKHDPDCAMCYWGEALVLGPNINAPMGASAMAPAITAVRAAQERANRATAREQALVEALTKRYPEAPNTDRAAADAAYAEAMAAVAERFSDASIQALYAEALMDLSPWDYWEGAGAKPKGKTETIVATLEKVLAKDPSHPGAIHYYIHIMEASATPEKAIPYARRLATAMPGAGHLMHMPFHIFFRTGDYKAALAANKAAVAVDEAYIARAAPTGIYPAAYYPHNVHSLMVSAQMAGDGKAAIAAAEKLARVVTSEASQAIPWVQPIQAAPYFAHAQFSPSATILGLADPGSDLPFVKAMWHYARGVAHAAGKNVPAARAEAEALAKLKGSDFAELVGGGVPAAEILELARQIVLARIALAQDRLEEARTAFEQAVAIQDQLPYSEPPHWYFPVRQSLGAVLIRLGKFEAAEEAFRTSLAKSPNNGWALFGLRELYGRSGQKSRATDIARRLDRAWAGDRSALDLARL
jgi:tetratricopeptide (TPR) repeat protein